MDQDYFDVKWGVALQDQEALKGRGFKPIFTNANKKQAL